MKLAFFPSRRPLLSPARLAITVIFFINGMVFSNWVPRIPTIQQHLGLRTGTLGLALWGVAIGSLLAQACAGRLVTYLGGRAATGIGVVLYCSALPLPALAINLPTLMLALFMLGATNGLLDVAMNAQGVIIERSYARPIFSSFHAVFSLGGLLGSLCGGIMASLGVVLLLHFCLITVVAVSAAIAALCYLPPSDRVDIKEERRQLPLRHQSHLLPLGIIAFCALLGEGTVADWSAVYLKGTLHTEAGLAAGGFAAFSLAMALGRFIGDNLTHRWGPTVLVRWSGLLATGGLGLALVIPQLFAAIVGYALFGIGLSCIVPIVLSAAGRLTRTQEASAIAAVSTIGYTGFLTGPPMIGLLAQWSTLQRALSVVVGFTFIIVLLARSVQRQDAAAR
jgi:predicted MFS family arabinose efflux permease